MKQHIRWVFILLALAILAPLAARQVWPQAVSVVEYENIEFDGDGCVLSDGSYLLAWTDTKDILFNARIMRYSQAHQPLWSQPLSLPDTNINRLYPTADGGFLVVYGPYMRMRRYDAQAQPLWNNQEYGLGVYLNGFEMAFAEESSGSIWLLCTAESDPATYHYISPSGVPAVQGGTAIAWSWSASRPNLILSPDGGAVLSIIKSSQNKIYRISQNQSVLWQQSIAAQPYSYVNALARDGANGFYLVYGCHTLLARRYDFGGQQLWAADVEFSPEAISGYRNWKVWRTSDGSLKAVWLAADGLHLGRISQDGTLLPEYPILAMSIEYETYLHDLHSLPGQSEPSFLSIFVSNSSSIKLLCCRLGESGFLDAQPVQMGIAPRFPDFCPTPWYGVVSSKLLCVYSHLETSQSRMLRVSCNQQSELESGQINSGFYGSFDEPVIAASPNQQLCAWLEKDPSSSSSSIRKRLRYQLFSPGGTSLLPQPGILPGSGSFATVSNLKVLAQADGQFLLFWRESSTPTRVRAQLVSSSGLPLWEPEGRILIEGSIQNYSLSQVSGDVFIAFELGGTNISIQKLSGGQPVWGSAGITIAPTGTFTGYIKLIALRGDYIVYGIIEPGSMFTGNESLWVLRFSPTGEVLPGFGQDGVSFLPVTNAIKLYCGGALLTPQGLLLRLDHGFLTYEDQVPIITVNAWIGHLIGMEGQTSWAEGLTNFKYYLLGADASGIYLRFVYPTHIVVRKYDYSGQQLWAQNCPITSYNNDMGDYGARALADGTWIGIGLVATNDYSPTLKYYSFSSGGSVNVPADSRLENRCRVRSAAIAESNDALYAVWAMNNNYSFEYSHLCIQKLNAIPVSNEDPVVPAPGVRLLDCRPNPFVSKVAINLESIRGASCRLVIYNLRGQKVKELKNTRLEQGSYSYSWDGSDEAGVPVASGIYFARLTAEGQKPQSSKIIKLK